MKTLNYEQMEQVQAQGWWGCLGASVGLALTVACLPATAPIGGLGALAFYYAAGQAGYACADAFANTKI